MVKLRKLTEIFYKSLGVAFEIRQLKHHVTYATPSLC
jgi:hypothetical protein